MKKSSFLLLACLFMGGCIQLANTYTPYNGKDVDNLYPRKNISITFEGYLFTKTMVSYGGAVTEYHEKRYNWENDTATTGTYVESRMQENPNGRIMRDYFEKIGYTINDKNPDYLVRIYPWTYNSTDGLGGRMLKYLCSLGFWQIGSEVIGFRVKVYNFKTSELIYDDVTEFNGEVNTISLLSFFPVGFMNGWVTRNAYALGWQAKAIEDALEEVLYKRRAN